MRNPYQIKIYETIEEGDEKYFVESFGYKPSAKYATLDDVKKEYERMADHFYEYIWSHLDSFDYDEMENTITIMADWDWYDWFEDKYKFFPEYYRMFVSKENIREFVNYEFYVVNIFSLEPKSRNFILKKAGSDMPW